MFRVATGNKESISRRDFFSFYVKRAKIRNKKTIVIREDAKKIQLVIFKKIAENLVNKKAGVFIKGFGYFFILIPPYKSVIRVPYKKEGYANFKTKNRVFTPTFLPISNKEKLMNLWCMDRVFNEKLKQELHKKIIKDSFRYKCYPYTLSTLYEFKNSRPIKL